MIDTSSLFLCRYSPSFDQQKQIIATTIASVVLVVVNVHTNTYTYTVNLNIVSHMVVYSELMHKTH